MNIIMLTETLMFLYQTCSFLKGTSVQWIDGQKVPYAVKGNQWVGFDNQRSYDAKVCDLVVETFSTSFSTCQFDCVPSDWLTRWTI